MARRRTRVNRRVRRCAAGLGAVGALVAFAPTAGADPLDDVFDQLLWPFLDPSAHTVAWDALLSPAAWDAFFSPAHWDSALAGLGAAGDVGTAASGDIYPTLHWALEGWIHSSLGAQVDDEINRSTGLFLIGDGAAGTAAHPDGGAGGLLFGDGGDGWNSTYAGVAGGNGGVGGAIGDGGAGGAGGSGADGGNGGSGGSVWGDGGTGGNGGAVSGWWGDGGSGGDGGAGTGSGVGGAGGDGGNGSWLIGSGGHGGDAGASAVGSTALPALGGAGGNAGIFGHHGTVGHFGTGGVPQTVPSEFTATGNWLTNSAGQAVILHGVNVVQSGKEAPYLPSVAGFDDADAALLAANGFNVVRLGVQWAGVEPEPGVYNYGYLAALERTVQMFGRHGIHVLLDMHQDLYSTAASTPLSGDGAPAWATDTGGLSAPDAGFPLTYPLSPAQNHAWDTFWANGTVDGVKLENNYAQMWEHVADYFKNDPAVLGYEIMNEPWPGSQWLPTLLGDPHFSAEELTPFYNQVDAAIRAVDPTTPVFFEPPVLEQELAPITLGTVNDPNTVFSFHPYCLSAALFGGLDIGCQAYDTLLQDGAQTYARSHDIPAMITEFGNTANPDVLNDEMGVANQHGYGWMFWGFWPEVVHNLNQPPVGANVDTGLLSTLAQPYPQLVSGTPGPWSFEHGAFSFTYSAEMADGRGGFPAGSQTTIAVPAGEYPHGYQVNVTGGHVVSAADAPQLIIASDSSAGTVRVVVSPVPAAAAR